MSGGGELLLIVNPTSGRGRARRWADAVAAQLAREGRAFRRIDEPLRAPLVASSPVAEHWVVGGDGTLNQLLQQQGGARARVALFPAGTGNVVAREIGLPLDLAGALAVARAGRPRPYDLGRVNDHRFAFMVSAGLDARIAGEVARARRGPMRRSDWLRAAFASRRATEPPFEVALDDGPSISVRYAAIFIGRYYAGPFRACPQARSDDGLFDVLLLRDPILPRWVRVAWAFLRGRAGALPDATWALARRVRMVGAPCSQIDGDPGPSGDLDVAIDAAAIEFFARA